MPLFPAPAVPVPGFWEMCGHSYGMTTVGTLYQTGRMDAVLRQLMDVEHMSWRNRCVTGAQITNQGRAQGGYVRILQEVTKSTRTAPYTANGGGLILCYGINDIGISGNTTQMRTAWKYALRTAISRWRASSVKEDSDASIAWGAGWTSNAGTQDYSSGTTTRRATTTTSATGTITLPADYGGETVALSFVGAAGVFGGTVTFSGTSALATSLAASFPSGLSTSNIMSGATHCPVTVRVKGTASDASKTIIMTVSQVDASGSVEFDSWWLEADNPPPVIVCNVARCTTAGYASYATWTSSQAGADTDVGNFNADLASVVAEFDSMVQVADIDTALNKGVPPAGSPGGVTTLLASDGVHPNEYGAARAADAIFAAVTRLTPPGPLGNCAYLQIDSPQSSALRRPRQSQSFYLPEFGVWAGTSYTAVLGDFFAIPAIVTEGRERWIQFQLEQTNAPTTSGSSIRWGIYDDVGWSGYPQDLIVEATSAAALALGTTSGMKQSPSSGAGQVNQPLDPGLYWIGLKVDVLGTTASQIRSVQGPSPLLPATAWVAGTAPASCGWKLTGQAAGAMPGTFPAGASVAGNGTGSTGVPCVGFKTF